MKELIVSHDLILLQDRLCAIGHSANIIGHNMYIYGGILPGDNGPSFELSTLNLSKEIFMDRSSNIVKENLSVRRNCPQSGTLPGNIKWDLAKTEVFRDIG